MTDYSRIINHKHHISSEHPQMSLSKRAAQFSPFAALVGYDDAVKEAGRMTSERVILDEDKIEEINYRLSILHKGDRISVTYFEGDRLKDGGEYVIASGEFDLIDSITGSLRLKNKTVIALEDIYDLQLAQMGSS